MLENTVLYAWPERHERVSYSMSASQSAVSDEHWNNWYHIKAVDGTEGWIAIRGEMSRGVIFGEFKQTLQKMQLHAVKSLYKQPTDSMKAIAELAPQTVTVKGQVGHWYQLDTWLGTLWMDDTDVTVLESGKK
ncbi:hypothetical protein D3C75_1074600 [compost metagenome]